MPLTPAQITSIWQALETHAQASGLFPGGVVSHEPWTAPTGGLAVAVMRGPMTPARGGSGLASTSMRLDFTVRIFAGRLQEPPGEIDPEMLAAECFLMGAYTSDLELDGVQDGLIRMVDVLGAYGDPVQSAPGYLPQDGTPMRITDITVPLILNDLFTQEVS